MQRYNCSFTATCVARQRLLRVAPAAQQHRDAAVHLRVAKRTYTAIPLSRVLTRRGALPLLFGNQSAAHRSSFPASPSATWTEPAPASATAATATTGSPLSAAADAKDGAAPPHTQQKPPYHFLQCRTASRASVLVHTTRTAAAAAAAHPATRSAPAMAATTAHEAALRVCASVQPAPRMACVRVPRLLIFGGDVVSVTALEALHARMRCVVRDALRCSRRSDGARARRGSPASPHHVREDAPEEAEMGELEKAEEDAAVDAFVREHITAVCPALPRGLTPEAAAKKFTRQYPVARYCVDHGLPIIPVDHPKSLTRSALLKEMLSTVQPVAASGPKGSSMENTTAVAAAASSSADASRTHKAVSVTAHLPSRVFSASQLVRKAASAPRGPAEAVVKGETTTPHDAGPTEEEEEPALHTWAAQGRPLADYDLAVVVSFRYFLPQKLLRVLPPVINMHPSLLPRYRGASPIFSALRHNEPVGGVSIIQMKPEQTAMDSGSILWQCEVPMTPDMDIRLYFPLVTQIGAAGLCDLIFGEAPSPNRSAAAAATAFASMHTKAAVTTAKAALTLHEWPSMHGINTHSTAVAAAAEATEETTHSGDATAGGPAVSHTNGGSNGHCESAAIPPWVAVRRSSLMPLVHRAAGHTSLPSPQQDRERLAPYVDRPELSVFSSIITAHTHAPKTADRSQQDEKTAATVAAANATEAATCSKPCLVEGNEKDGGAGARQCHHWMTLCRSSTLITPEAVYEASKAHRALFFQNLESASAASGAGLSGGKRKNTPHNKKQVSPAAAAELEISTAMKCAEVFPKSVLSSHCDWPDSFTYSWKFAQLQEYQTFAHFTEDPFHAPLLPKDAAVLRFSAFTALEAFGVWRAFVGGDYFQPSLNATLDKGSTPVRNQLVHRGVRRLLRERAKEQKKKNSTQPKQRQQQVPGNTSDSGAGAAAAPSSSAPATVATGEESPTPVGIVVGKHVELDVFNPAGLQLLTEAEHLLRTPCTFTQVTNPTLVPPCVQAELAEVERGGDRCCGTRPAAPLSGRRVRFYRAPPALFRSLLHHPRGATAVSSDDAKAEDEGAEWTCVQSSTVWGNKTKARGCCGQWCSGSAASTTQDAGDSGEPRQKKQPEHHRGKRGAQQLQPPPPQQPDEPAEDEEAPEDYVPDVIHAAPPTEHRWHIPPGTGYFPESDESYGAIKCSDGWFLWKEAHMKWSNKAQPAVLIRKGLAMKTGVLYVGLFSEYS